MCNDFRPATNSAQSLNARELSRNMYMMIISFDTNSFLHCTCHAACGCVFSCLFCVLHTADVIYSCGWVSSFLFYICIQVMSYVACGCLCSFLFYTCTQVMSYVACQWLCHFLFCICTRVMSYVHVGGCVTFCFTFVHGWCHMFMWVVVKLSVLHLYTGDVIWHSVSCKRKGSWWVVQHLWMLQVSKCTKHVTEKWKYWSVDVGMVVQRGCVPLRIFSELATHTRAHTHKHTHMHTP